MGRRRAVARGRIVILGEGRSCGGHRDTEDPTKCQNRATYAWHRENWMDTVTPAEIVSGEVRAGNRGRRFNGLALLGGEDMLEAVFAWMRWLPLGTSQGLW